MEVKTIALFLVSLIALFIAFGVGFFFPLNNFFSFVPISLAIIGFFLFGAAMYGYFAFIPHVFFGLALGSERNAAIFVFLAPIAIATYAGVKFGNALMDDLLNKKYFLKEGKNILILLIIALVLGIAIELFMPTIIDIIWMDDYWGMQMKDNGTVGDFIGELTSLI
ncbi:MAG: hypothetical protein HN878_02005 [Candidatus Diapherotrites archaeon]|jgi:hypothetical protein|nr:hypothetical protein [Candidatus Diapherotrites archaeon]